MKNWLTFAPWWVLSLVLIVAFFGLFMGPFLVWSNRQAEAAAGLENRDEFLAASRAVHRGPAPADSRLRSAAFRMAIQQHEVTQRAYRFTLPLLGLGAIALIVLSFFATPWLLLGTVFLAGLLLVNVLVIRRLERRMLVLFDRRDYEDDLESDHY